MTEEEGRVREGKRAWEVGGGGRGARAHHFKEGGQCPPPNFPNDLISRPNGIGLTMRTNACLSRDVVSGLERLGLETCFRTSRSRLGLETQTSRDLAFRETFRLKTIYVELKLQTESNKWKSCFLFYSK